MAITKQYATNAALFGSSLDSYGGIFYVVPDFISLPLLADVSSVSFYRGC